MKKLNLTPLFISKVTTKTDITNALPHVEYLHQQIKLKIGAFVKYEFRAYRILRDQYYQLKFTGEKNDFDLTIQIGSNTLWPEDHEFDKSFRVYVEVGDFVDAIMLKETLISLFEGEAQ